MIDPAKTDKDLGEVIQNLLIEKGIETPMIKDLHSNSNKEKIIEEKFSLIMEVLGLDIEDDSLKETPKRFAKMLVRETMYGLDYANFPRVMDVENKFNYKSMVRCDGVPINSVCEHHFQNIIGSAIISYIPNEKIIGLSKIHRITDFFCRRPQVQERLNEQIFFSLQYLLGTENVAIMIKAKHFCMACRGVQDAGGFTTTTRLGGSFETDISVRQEYFSQLK